MSVDVPNKFTDALKALWRLEISLRWAALNGIVLRKPAAAAHLAEARQHFDNAVTALRNGQPPSGPPATRQ